MCGGGGRAAGWARLRWPVSLQRARLAPQRSSALKRLPAWPLPATPLPGRRHGAVWRRRRRRRGEQAQGCHAADCAPGRTLPYSQPGWSGVWLASRGAAARVPDGLANAELACQSAATAPAACPRLGGGVLKHPELLPRPTLPSSLLTVAPLLRGLQRGGWLSWVKCWVGGQVSGRAGGRRARQGGTGGQLVTPGHSCWGQRGACRLLFDVVAPSKLVVSPALALHLLLRPAVPCLRAAGGGVLCLAAGLHSHGNAHRVGAP